MTSLFPDLPVVANPDKPASAKGYAAMPGSGPEGEACKSCRHLVRRQWDKVYLKCGLMREHWTKGPGSDIKARSPACAKWETNDPEAIVEAAQRRFDRTHSHKARNALTDARTAALAGRRA